MKLILENWRKYVNENKDLFTYIKSGRNRDIFMNYSDTYNIYLDWISWDKKDPAARAYVNHFDEMAAKYSETTGESPYWKNPSDIWDVKPEFYRFFDPSDLVAAIKRQQGRSDPGAVRRLTKRLKKDYDSIEAAEEMAKKTNELANQAYKSLMSYRKEFLDQGAITGAEENKRIVDHLPSAFIYRPFMNPPGYEGTDLAGKVDIRGAHLEQ
jgi:hypothetical protein